MTKTKRVNPRRKPMTNKQAWADGQSKGTSCACAIFLTALLDKGFVSPDRIEDVWAAVNDLSDSIAKGYVNLSDLRKTLLEEYNIRLT